MHATITHRRVQGLVKQTCCVHCRKIIFTLCKFEFFKMAFLYLLLCVLLTYSNQTGPNLREKVNHDHIYILKKFGMFFKMPLWYKYIMFVLNRIYQVISHLLAQFSSFQIIIKIHFDVANIEIWILMQWIVSSA